jgi:hypothetical protein
MANPIIDYDVNIIYAGANLRVEGEGTPNITAIYDDVAAVGTLATCRVNIQYSNVQWTLNNDNSVTITGNITTSTLTRNRVYQGSSGLLFNIWADFNGARRFSTTVVGASSGTYNLNFPPSFSITVPPQSTSTAASIHYFNQWTEGGSSPSYQPDEFTVGLIVTNPNLPDYRPGAIRDSSGVWLSHNRSGGEVHILTGGGTWREERTMNGGDGKGNPPSIRKNDLWFNQRKIGKE